MGIKILATPETTLNYHLGQISLDLSRKTGVLIRQSKKKADKEHYESRLLQESLAPIAIECRGDVDDRNILMYDEGAGISGTKGYDERPKLSKLYLDIANDVTGSLFIARPDRLFRDKHFLNVGIFTELAERKALILVVPGKRVYNFTVYADLEAFQKDMLDAYKYIATHIQYMIDTRKQKRGRGLYAGGSLPAPYVIDKLAWKDEQIPLIYTPWLDPALDLFTRFKAFDFSMAHICRYIESLPYIFPAPPFEDTKRWMFLTKMFLTNGGYCFSTASVVTAYLSNLTMGGYMKVGKDEEGNVLFLPDAFEAAIPLDLLDECFASIMGHHIDGSPFEGVRNTMRYMRSNPKGAMGIFQNIITSDQGRVKVDTNLSKEYHHYECTQENKEENEERTWKLHQFAPVDHLWRLGCRRLDRIMLDRLYAIAQYNQDIAERVKAVFASMQGQEMDEAKLLQKQVQETTARINRLNFLLRNPDIPLDEQTARDFALELSELRPKLERLTKKINTQPDINPEETITNFYFVVGHLSTEFEKQGIDVQKQIMSKLVKKMVVNNLSPHLFFLYIEWQEGVAFQPDVALLWRGVALKDLNGWTKEEDAAIRTYWPEGSEMDVLSHLPQRSRLNISTRASDLGVKRTVRKAGRVKVCHYHRSITYADLQAVEQYLEGGISEECLLLLGSVFNNGLEPLTQEDKAEMKERLLEKVNELAEVTEKGRISAYFPMSAELLGLFSITGHGGSNT